jgi:hypothetical protein
MKKIAALIVVAVIAGYGLHAFAQGRIDMRPSVTPIGSSSSNGISFAWFYDATERTVYVCRSGHGNGDTVECRARVSLP